MGQQVCKSVEDSTRGGFDEWTMLGEPLAFTQQLEGLIPLIQGYARCVLSTVSRRGGFHRFHSKGVSWNLLLGHSAVRSELLESSLTLMVAELREKRWSFESFEAIVRSWSARVTVQPFSHQDFDNTAPNAKSHSIKTDVVTHIVTLERKVSRRRSIGNYVRCQANNFRLFGVNGPRSQSADVLALFDSGDFRNRAAGECDAPTT